MIKKQTPNTTTNIFLTRCEGEYVSDVSLPLPPTHTHTHTHTSVRLHLGRS